MPLLELPHGKSCLVCSSTNPHGLHLSLHLDPDTQTIHTTFTPAPHHVGFENTLHGGLLATVLDEAMVWAAIVTSKRACLAAELTTRFLAPARPGISLTCTAQVTLNNRRLLQTAGTLTDSTGQPIASATAKYIPLPHPATETFLAALSQDPSTLPALQLLQSPHTP